MNLKYWLPCTFQKHGGIEEIAKLTFLNLSCHSCKMGRGEGTTVRFVG